MLRMQDGYFSKLCIWKGHVKVADIERADCYRSNLCR
jgi:hypothetical protein